MDIAKQVGQRLQQARKNCGLTQKEVGALLNMVQQNYARYEKGVVELNYEKLIFLCQLFHITSDYLLGLED